MCASSKCTVISNVRAAAADDLLSTRLNSMEAILSNSMRTGLLAMKKKALSRGYRKPSAARSEHRIDFERSSRESPLKPPALMPMTFRFVKAEITLARTEGISPDSNLSSLSPKRCSNSDSLSCTSTSIGESRGSCRTMCG